MRAATKIRLVAAFVVGLTFTSLGQPGPVLTYQEGRVWVTGINPSSISTEQWEDFLRVFTHEAFSKRLNQPVAGTYAWHGDSLSFKPTFNFVAGARYHAVLGKLELSFTIPEEKVAPTFVEAVYPQTDKLPANMLRMHISFSAPMMVGKAYDHIKLFTENGALVEKAFLIIDQELWDADHKRLTLLFDPGRVKQGIKSNLELGAPLKAGEKYRLAIDASWGDVHGNALGRCYTKTFSVTKAQRTKLSANTLSVSPPVASSDQDVVIGFDRPMDDALALKYITIYDAQLNEVKGKAQLIKGNTWKFTPDHVWGSGTYVITLSPLLEDVAGNNFNNAFDIDLSKDARINSIEPIRIPFTIKPLE